MMRNLGGRICDACIRPKRHIRIFENDMSTFPTIICENCPMIFSRLCGRILVAHAIVIASATFFLVGNGAIFSRIGVCSSHMRSAFRIYAGCGRFLIRIYAD